MHALSEPTMDLCLTQSFAIYPQVVQQQMHCLVPGTERISQAADLAAAHVSVFGAKMKLSAQVSCHAVDCTPLPAAPTDEQDAPIAGYEASFHPAEHTV